MTHRFLRTEMLLGKEGLERLRNARVLVVGLGAVGSYAVEGLARAGVGHLRLADFDVVRPSNINRQLYALESTLNRPKAEIARERVLDINPQCDVEALRVFADAETALGLLSPAPDVVIDAIDSVNPKVELIAAAVTAGVCIVSSMGAATRIDHRAVRVADISETSVCPLARMVRKKLKTRGIERGVTCVFSTEPPDRAALGEVDAETPPGEREALERGRRRRPLGSLSCLTGMFGLIAAHEAILKIARR
jgi:tRNA A37 threonylcarbamoyladenosine dehydratase